MKKDLKSFYEAGVPESATYEQKVRQISVPVLADLQFKAKVQKRAKFRALWFGWVPAGAALAALAVVAYNTWFAELGQKPMVAMAPVVPFVPAPDAMQLPPDLAKLNADLDSLKPLSGRVAPTTLRDRSKQTKIVRTQQPRPKVDPQAGMRKLAVEFLRDFDVIEVLPVLRDLDVLMRWNGAVGMRGLGGLPSRLFSHIDIAPSAYAAEIPLSNDIFDQILKVFPSISQEEQSEIMGALERLKRVWPTEKDTLTQNYNTWRTLSKTDQIACRQRLKTWHTLPAKTRQGVLVKYENWKSLPEGDRVRLRKALRSAVETKNKTSG